ELNVVSEPGRGAKFWFEIELQRASESEPVGAKRRVIGLEPGQAPRRVLVVDNDPDNRRLLARLIAVVGLEVRPAWDGRQAIAIWQEWHPDFIWMDMRMPGMNGYDATLAIRRLEQASGLARTAIVALTASAFEHDRASILSAGCDDAIAKPFHEADIFGV